MYVCLCHGITERAIRKAASEGVASFAELQERTGVATCCGSCREYAEDTWQEALTVESSARVGSAAQVWYPVL